MIKRYWNFLVGDDKDFGALICIDISLFHEKRVGECNVSQFRIYLAVFKE